MEKRFNILIATELPTCSIEMKAIKKMVSKVAEMEKPWSTLQIIKSLETDLDNLITKLGAAIDVGRMTGKRRMAKIKARSLTGGETKVIHIERRLGIMELVQPLSETATTELDKAGNTLSESILEGVIAFKIKIIKVKIRQGKRRMVGLNLLQFFFSFILFQCSYAMLIYQKLIWQ